ncbi:helix-turn-helix domain-containing protein [Roseateles sp. DC23W]|uniref:Helix-turn-helix domain-containing protein n=1 Tax=Pelomonas dachongensis TaxID=3299029 RepID=A0ABW7EUW6_9BURK
MKTTVKSNFPRALRRLRQALGLAQEAFDVVSSRTYISSLERGLKDPTVGKVEQLAAVMAVHPLTLLVLAYSDGSSGQVGRLLTQVEQEVRAALAAENH